MLERIKREDLGAPVIWLCKGFEPGKAKLPHQVCDDVLGRAYDCGVVSGPSFAEEVARGLPTAVTLASRNAEFARDAARALHSPAFRVYSSSDVIGVEVAGAVKNVMAIAAGICDGLGYGYNARAALITRGLAEITRLGVALGGRAETFMGLAGAGDLILTCTGDLSRNRRVGLKLAQGEAARRDPRRAGTCRRRREHGPRARSHGRRPRRRDAGHACGVPRAHRSHARRAPRPTSFCSASRKPNVNSL